MNEAKIYVGNLPYKTSDEDLREFFNDCGNIVDLKLIIDKATGRSKGFAFISFDHADAVQEALKLNSAMLDGRQIKVSLAKEERSRDDRGGRGDRGDRGGRGGDRRRSY